MVPMNVLDSTVKLSEADDSAAPHLSASLPPGYGHEADVERS